MLLVVARIEQADEGSMYTLCCSDDAASPVLLESAESMQRSISKKAEAMLLLLKSDESLQRSGSEPAEAMLLLLESAASMPRSRSTKADAMLLLFGSAESMLRRLFSEKPHAISSSSRLMIRHKRRAQRRLR